MLSYLIFTIRSAKVTGFVSPHALAGEQFRRSLQFPSGTVCMSWHPCLSWIVFQNPELVSCFSRVACFLPAKRQSIGMPTLKLHSISTGQLPSKRPGGRWMFLHVYWRVLDVAFLGRNLMTTTLERQAIMCTTAETRSYHPPHPIRPLCWRPVLKSHDMSIQ